MKNGAWMVATGAVTLALAAVPGGSAQSSITPTVSVAGRVIADDTGDAVSNARVSIGQVGSGALVVLSDQDGRFTITPPLVPTPLTITKPGFARQSVSASAVHDGMDIRLRRAATLSGRVVDEFGVPVVAAQVSVEVADPAVTGASRVLRAVETDDRGEYRAGGLPTGDVVVVASTIAGSAVVRRTETGVEYAATPQRTFFPGVSDRAAARVVRLERGQDRSSIDIVVSGDQIGGQTFGMTGGWPGMPLADRPSRTPSSISGRIVDDSGRGIARAFVRLVFERSPFTVRAIRTDIDGRFEFGDLAPASFHLGAWAAGFTAVGVTSDLAIPTMPMVGAGPIVTVRSGERRRDVTIRMKRLGTVSGRVVDEGGDPVEDARVQLLTVIFRAGRRQLVDAGVEPRVTNDRGEYRVYDVPRGRYIVSVAIGAVGSGDVPGYTRSYFPGTPDAGGAQFVVLTQANRPGVDLTMTRTPTARVSGRIYNSLGQPAGAGRVELRPTARSVSAVGLPVGARLLPDGVFEFPNVVPGEYVVVADRGRAKSSMEDEFGATVVSVTDGNVSDVVVQMSAGSSVTGRMVFEPADPPEMPRREIELWPVGVDPDLTPSAVAVADIHEDWTFSMSGLNGPRRLVLAHAPDGWFLKAVRLQGIDITDQVLDFGARDQSLADVEVLLTNRVAGVMGAVTARDGRSLQRGDVIVFSTDPTLWHPASRYLRRGAIAEDGTYRIVGMAPGQYYIAAVRQLPEEGDMAWQAPAFLEGLTQHATMVTLSDGQAQTFNIRLGTQ